MSDDLFDELARRLADAHARVRALDASQAEKASAARRLLVINDLAKHDLARASRRLDALLDDIGGGDRPS